MSEKRHFDGRLAELHRSKRGTRAGRFQTARQQRLGRTLDGGPKKRVYDLLHQLPRAVPVSQGPTYNRRYDSVNRRRTRPKSAQFKRSIVSGTSELPSSYSVNLAKENDRTASEWSSDRDD